MGRALVAGDRVGDLKVLKFLEWKDVGPQRVRIFLLRCVSTVRGHECGAELQLESTDAKKREACPKCRHYKKAGYHPGAKFGSLTLLRDGRTKGTTNFWICRCECGAECEYPTKDLQRPLTTKACRRCRKSRLELHRRKRFFGMMKKFFREKPRNSKSKRTERNPAHVYRFANGLVMVFGIDGQQMPRLQGRWSEKRDEIMRRASPSTKFFGCDYPTGKTWPLDPAAEYQRPPNA